MEKQRLRLLSSNIIILLTGAALGYFGFDKQNTAMMAAGAVLFLLGAGRYYLLKRLLDASLAADDYEAVKKTEDRQEEH